MNEVETVDLLEGTEQDVNLSHVQTLVNSMFGLEREIEDLEEKMKEKRQRLEDLKTRAIPDAMGNLTQLRVGEGSTRATVSIEKVIRGNIKVENRERAFKWLDETGHGDIIKTAIEIKFGREKLNEAKEALDKIKSLGYNPQLEQEVHWQTLAAFCREQLEKGMEFPDSINVFEGKTTKVKYGK